MPEGLKPVLVIDNRELYAPAGAHDDLVRRVPAADVETLDPSEWAAVFVHDANQAELNWARAHFRQHFGGVYFRITGRRGTNDTVTVNRGAYKLPRRYADAVARYGEDSLLRHGIVPWHVAAMKNQLTAAFQARDADRILRLSADMGHYVADACVPLHTTRNYNGQLTGQRGIHGLWESRLPELLATDYDLFTGRAVYLDQPTETIWAAVARSNAAVDSVLRFERELTASFPADQKYGYEQRGSQTTRTYSREFSRAYHQRLNGQVERQLRYAASLIGAFWYTCWVDAGSPDLGKLPRQPSPAEQARLEKEALEAAAAPSRTLPGHDE